MVLLIVYKWSGKVVSFLKKNPIPNINIKITIMVDINITVPGACVVPINAHLNPSITPTMGFKP